MKYHGYAKEAESLKIVSNTVDMNAYNADEKNKK
jgi:hypothetical protein